MGNALLFLKPEPTWGKGKQDGNCFALSFAGIIQIRYEGYVSPETQVPGPLANCEFTTTAEFVQFCQSAPANPKTGDRPRLTVNFVKWGEPRRAGERLIA